VVVRNDQFGPDGIPDSQASEAFGSPPKRRRTLMKIVMATTPVVTGNAANNSKPLRSTIMPVTLALERINTQTWHFRENPEEEGYVAVPLVFLLGCGYLQ